VDPENEDKLRAAFESLMKNKTVIMIAHRLNTIRNAHQIVVVNNAGITVGTHEQLIKEDGLYSRFVKMREQAAGWKL
nr:ABC transporter ATP-binding protein [Lachnospiraceae bacterium]